MPVTTPDDAVLEFAELLKAGDLQAALSLYTGDAAFLPDPGTVLVGAEAIRSGLTGYFALRPALTPGARRVLVVDDIALVIHDWQLSGSLPDGTPLEQTGRAVDVLRRQADGTWRFLIDNPWGGSVLDAAVPADTAAGRG